MIVLILAKILFMKSLFLLPHSAFFDKKILHCAQEFDKETNDEVRIASHQVLNGQIDNGGFDVVVIETNLYENERNKNEILAMLHKLLFIPKGIVFLPQCPPDLFDFCRILYPESRIMVGDYINNVPMKVLR